MNELKLHRLLRDLLSFGGECEWIEFKCNNDDPKAIGEYLSAIANSAALNNKGKGYIVWGVDDQTRQIVGTTFKPHKKKVSNEALENWLSHLLSPRLDFRVYEFQEQGKSMAMFEVPAACHTPVRFKDYEYIRVGSYKKKLKDYPEKERALWSLLSHQSFEKGCAADALSTEEVLSLIDYPAFFELLGQTLPGSRSSILEKLQKERVIAKGEDNAYSISNLGAILFAKHLDKFERLARKAVRVIFYEDDSRTQTRFEMHGNRGYAVGFAGLIEYISSMIPRNEAVEQALRREAKLYPIPAIRELVANALIHQDFSLTGTGPTIEVFLDRIEVTNPGVPLIDTLRFIDEPPQSRNERLAALMRRMGICEERGSGIDKVVLNVELFQLPAPDFQVTSSHTKVVLYAPKKLSEMAQCDRIRACYQHACLCWVSNKQMTNASLRKRFGIADRNSATASRIIGETVKVNLIRLANPEVKSKRHAQYVPFWG